MKPNLNLIRKYFSCCLNCGSFIVKSGRLCGPCSKALNSLKRSSPALTKPFKVITLYRWHPGQSDMLSRLVLSLKGSRGRRDWQYYARQFALAHFPELTNHERIYVVPAPSKKTHQKDHATLWAEELAVLLGAECLPCLQKKKEVHQRGADRAERALIEMEIIENNTKNVNFSARSLWIFADDIVTTGATARAAHIALGRPSNFVVCALAHRSLSCGASSDLLYQPHV